MRRLNYSMGVSLDGFIAGPGGDFSWAEPDEELHRFHNEQMRETGVALFGRRLYEMMAYWETADEQTSASEHELEFARFYQGTPKVVFSTTLERVEGDARLVRGGLAEEVAALKAQPGGDLTVGGAGLAAACIELDLVDEYGLFVYPVVAGGGTPFFPALDARIDLELLETRTFASRVAYLRYRRTPGDATE